MQATIVIERTRQAPVIVVAPDSFKGSLYAAAACSAIAEGLRRVWPDAEVRERPMADGGEGTLDAVLAAMGRDGERRTMTVVGASGAPVAAAWGLVGASGAIIEVAQVVGLTDAEGTRVPVAKRSTRGVGELIRGVLDAGVLRLMIGLGGSSTNDGGAGLLAALGMRLLDAAGRAVAPAPEGLATLHAVDVSTLDARLADTSITIMSDVSNPLCGERGATAIFGPQKGVRDHQIGSIDETLARFAALAEAALERRVASLPGAGAAGGLGFALQLIGGRMCSGAEVVADLIGLAAAFDGAHWAITGEGRSDAQTLLGKAPWVVARHGAQANVPVSLLSGALDARALDALNAHFAGCFALPDGPMTLEQCIANARSLLADRAEAIARVFAKTIE